MHYPLPYRLVLSLVEVGHSRFLVVLLAILVIAADGKSDSLDLPHSRVSHLTNHKVLGISVPVAALADQSL